MKRFALLVALTCAAHFAHATVITFDDADLSSGNPVTDSGLQLLTTTDTGTISFIGSGTFQGLWLDAGSAQGNFNLAFSQAITSISIEFDALSDIGSGDPETISNFAADAVSIAIGYTNQFGTTFDGSTITSTENDGQGIITYSGAAFSNFSFTHLQGAQNGFVLEHIIVDTADVPAPATVLIFALGLLGLASSRRRVC